MLWFTRLTSPEHGRIFGDARETAWGAGDFPATSKTSEAAETNTDFANDFKRARPSTISDTGYNDRASARQGIGVARAEDA
jgi:hypothetical protein